MALRGFNQFTQMNLIRGLLDAKPLNWAILCDLQIQPPASTQINSKL